MLVRSSGPKRLADLAHLSAIAVAALAMHSTLRTQVMADVKHPKTAYNNKRCKNLANHIKKFAPRCRNPQKKFGNIDCNGQESALRTYYQCG
jgi:hypothetical protein